MLKFNVEGRVGTIVIERASAGNAFTGEMVRQLGEIIRRAVEEADIVTLAGAGADFTIGRDRHKPKSSPFDAFRNISALNKAIAEFPGVLITGVRGRAFGLGVGLFEHLPAKRALDFILMGVNSALTTRWIGPHFARGWARRLRRHGGRIRRNAALAGAPRRARLQALFARGWQMPPEARSAYALVEQTQFAIGDTQ
jgi:enoyl-CoA hydratase/isomerase-like protein